MVNSSKTKKITIVKKDVKLGNLYYNPKDKPTLERAGMQVVGLPAGIVIQKDSQSNGVTVVYYFEGYPYKLLDYSKDRCLLDKTHALEDLTTVEQHFGAIYQQGELADPHDITTKLQGAIAARKQDIVIGIRTAINKGKGPRDYYRAATQPIKKTDTGIFVIQGVYDSRDAPLVLQGAEVVPSGFSEQEITDALNQKPESKIVLCDAPENKLTQIPKHLFDLFPDERYKDVNLRRYRAYEIPKRAVHLVPEPAELGIII